MFFYMNINIKKLLIACITAAVWSNSGSFAASCSNSRYQMVGANSTCPVGSVKIEGTGIPCREDSGTDSKGAYIAAGNCAPAATGVYEACEFGFFVPIIVSGASVSGNPSWTMAAVPNTINSWQCMVMNQSSSGSQDMIITLSGNFSDLDTETEALYFWNRSGVVKGSAISGSGTQRKFRVYYSSWHRHDSPQTCGFGYFAVNKTKAESLPSGSGFPYYAITMWGSLQYKENEGYKILTNVHNGGGNFKMNTRNESNMYQTDSPYVHVWLIQKYNRANNNSFPTGLPATTGGSWNSPITWSQVKSNNYSAIQGVMTKTTMNAHDSLKTQMNFSVTGY
jgi:hypothetical protein